MKTAGTGAEIDIGEITSLFARIGAIPETGGAMDALLAIEKRDASVRTCGDGLARAHLDTNLGAAFLAFSGIHENNMVRETIRGLDFTA